jgi:DNA transformation protein
MARKVRPARRAAGKKRFRSLKVSDGFKSFVLGQLEEFGDITSRSMFGGIGLYHRDVFFGIVASDTLYLKVDDSNRADYERAGMTSFTPYPGRAVGVMTYGSVPLAVLESAPELAEWARKAIGVARRG